MERLKAVLKYAYISFMILIYVCKCWKEVENIPLIMALDKSSLIIDRNQWGGNAMTFHLFIVYRYTT